MITNHNNIIEAYDKDKTKKIVTDASDYLQYLLMIPIILANKSEQYDPTLPSQTLGTKEANFQTIIKLENLKLDSPTLIKILREFKFLDIFKTDCSFIIEHVFQIIISLIHQDVPFLSIDKLDKDIFDKISSYQFKTEYIGILMKFYIQMFISDNYKTFLDIELKIIHICSIYTKIPITYNDDYFSYYLDVGCSLIYAIDRNVCDGFGIFNQKFIVPLFKRILLFLTNIYLYGDNIHAYKLLHVLRDILVTLSFYDKVLFIYCIDYLIIYMLDTFIDIVNRESEIMGSVEEVINVILEEIIKLENPIKQELLGRLKKWFILNIKTCVVDYSDKFGYIEEDEDFNYEDLYRFPDWYYTEEVLITIFFDMLPWLMSHCNGITLLSLYICNGYKFLNHNKERYTDDYDEKGHYSYGKKSFLNSVKSQILTKLFNDISPGMKGKLILPSWYDQLLCAIYIKNEKDVHKEVEFLVNILMGNNI